MRRGGRVVAPFFYGQGEQMGYLYPLLKLPATKRLLQRPKEEREALAEVFKDLRAEADDLAEENWRRRKGPMAAYWRAVSTYARHFAHALTKGA